MAPSRPPNRGLLSASEAAAVIGVSATRLRAMVEEGKVAPVAAGDRFLLYRSAELNRFMAQRKGQQVTPVAALLDAPAEPLNRVYDSVLDVPTLSRRGKTHVRIWEGADGSGVSRTVVLATGLNDEVSPGQSAWEVLAAEVNRQLLGGRGIDAVWFLQSDCDPADLDNVVQYQAKRVEFRNWFARKPSESGEQNELVHPDFRASDWVELERVVGQQVEFYPLKAHTQEVIHHWQRAGHTVDVVDDSSVGLGRLITALQVMDRVRPKDRHASLAHRAAVQIAEDIRERRTFLNDYPMWEDGTNLERSSRVDPSRLPTVFAARLVKPTLTADQIDLVEQYPPDTEPWPWSTPYLETYDALVEGLWQWHEEVDEFADEPNARTDEAVLTAFGLFRHWSKTAHWAKSGDLHRPGPPHPAASPRSVWTSGDTDRRYIKSLVWEPADAPETRAHRMLRAEIGTADEVRFGYDHFGHLVAVVSREPRPGFAAFAHVTALWPHTPPTRGLPPGTAFVADDGPGPRPAYIQYPDGRLDLLPVQAGSTHDQWHFGYAGGGPGMLRAAITHTVAEVDGIDDQAIPYGWLSDAIDHSARDHLSINVDDIRRRFKPVTRP